MAVSGSVREELGWTVVAQIGPFDILDGLFGVAVALVGAGLVFRGLRDLREWWRFRGVDGSGVRSSHGESVALEGTAEPADETVEAPFTGTECLAYSYEIRENEPTAGFDRPASSWRDIDDGDDAVPFLLDVDGERAFVCPDAMRVDVERDAKEITVPGAGNPPEQVQSFLADAADAGTGSASPNLLTRESDDRRRYDEGRLESGDTAVVSGVVRDPVDVDRRVPPDVDGVVVGGSGSSGGGLPATVADRPLAGVAEARVDRGAGQFAVGLVLVPTGLFIAGVYRFL